MPRIKNCVKDGRVCNVCGTKARIKFKQKWWCGEHLTAYDQKVLDHQKEWQMSTRSNQNPESYSC